MSREIYDEHTGNPRVDNAARRWNAIFRKQAKQNVHLVTPRGRRRKKHITLVTRKEHIELFVAVMRSQMGD